MLSADRRKNNLAVAKTALSPLDVEIAVVCNELWKALVMKSFGVFCKDVVLLYNKKKSASLKHRNIE